jgi:hypothetical protein
MRLSLVRALSELFELALQTSDYCDYIRQQGIAMNELAPMAGTTAVIDVVDCGGQRFDWAARGNPFRAFVCEAYEADGVTTADLVAWPIVNPRNVYSMFGNAAWVGASRAWSYDTYYLGKALDIHRCPLDWIKAGCTGAAVVDQNLAARELIDLPGPIAARDRSHAEELATLIQTVTKRTRILVPRDRVN